MYEYDVDVVPGKLLGKGHTWSEDRLQELLNTKAAEGWRLRFITEERERLLVTFERTLRTPRAISRSG